jgi:hypothetical protein
LLFIAVWVGAVVASATPRAWPAGAAARLEFTQSVALHTSPTLGQPGDVVSVWISDPDKARRAGIAYPVKYAVANPAGDRIAALSSRTDSRATFQTRAWAPGGYLLTAEIDPPGSGAIRLARRVFLGDWERAVDRFIREAPVGIARRSRAGMTLAYCADRVEALRNEGPAALRRSSDEIVEYFGWSQEFRRATRPDDLFRDRKGSHVRAYWSALDDTPQYYALYAPATYDRGRPIPLVVSLHGYDPANVAYAARNRMVNSRMRQWAEQFGYLVLEPFGRGNAFYRGIGEDDVFRAVEETCNDYDVDRDRIYLMGYSMGGSGTWNIGTACADRFAAIAPVYGRSDYMLQVSPKMWASLTPKEIFLLQRISPFYLAGNLAHTPAFINHGDRDELVDVENSRLMAFQLERLGYDVRYWEHPGLGHGGLPIEETLFQWFERYRRPTAPSRVRFKTASLHHGRMNWVTIERFEQLFDFASVDARIAPDNVVSIQSNNVSVMMLSPPAALINAERPLDVVWNGREAEVERIGERLWRLISPDAPKDALTAPLRKTASLEGPMEDVWTSPFLIVQGTQASNAQMLAVVEAEARNVAGRWNEWQHAAPRIKRDTDITAGDLAAYHLILVGGPEENFVARQLLADLPVKVASDSIEFFGEKFAGRDLGLAMIYPNPTYPNRYAMFLMGTSPAGLFDLDARSDKQFDFCLVDGRTVTEGNGRPAPATTHVRRTMAAGGFFDQEWQYRPQYGLTGHEETRRAVKALHRAPLYASAADAPARLFLSDLMPARQTGAFRDMALDRGVFGEPLRLGARRRFGSNTYPKGIASQVVHARTAVEYALAGQYKRFHAVVGLQRPEGSDLTDTDRKNTRVVFTVTGDGNPLWQSPPVTWDSGPVAVDLDISSIQTLGLGVQNSVTWHYRADSANWCDARVER